jgi:hypothetical protein
MVRLGEGVMVSIMASRDDNGWQGYPWVVAAEISEQRITD